MNWHLVKFLYGPLQPAALIHMVQAPLVEAIRADVMGRAKPGVYTEILLAHEDARPMPGLRGILFALPGIEISARPTIDVTIDGLPLRIPCQDVGDLYARIDRSAVRELPGRRDYVKLKGDGKALVLDLVQAADLRAFLREHRQDADRRAALFLKDWERRARIRHREANA